MKKTTNRIFICHAKEDKDQASNVYNRLKKAGYHPWVDKEDLLPGQNWKQEIPRALKSARFVVILFSRHSFKDGYVQREFKLALDTLKDMPSGKLFIIPGRLENCDIPDEFEEIQYCDLFEDDGFDRILRTIRSQLSETQTATSDAGSADKSAEGDTVGLSLEDHQEFKQLREQLTHHQKMLESLQRRNEENIRKPSDIPGNNSTKEFTKLQEELEQKQQKLEELKKQKAAESKKQSAQSALTPKQQIKPKTVFRSEPDNSLSVNAVKEMQLKNGFYDSRWNQNGKGFASEFEADGKVVVDKASGLMWQQSGSSNSMAYANAKKYVADLNRNNLAGYSDWRLPTLEEAMSLMEPEKKNGSRFDPVFNRAQVWIWTADKESAERAWGVNFFYGYCVRYHIDFDYSVRAVRSGQSSSGD